jgi:hypothetical protein
MSEMTKEEALAHMREKYPDDPQWQNYDLNAKPETATAPPPPPSERTVGLKAGSLELGAAGLGGAYVGNKLSKWAGEYKPPEAKPNAALIAQQELEKHRLGLSGGLADYELKADALKRQADALKELHLMELQNQAAARDALIAAQSKAAPPAVATTPESKLIVTPSDLQTRQIQGTGGTLGDIGTGRSRGSGYQATTQQIAEHGAEGQKTLSALQQQGVVKPHGVTVEFPGITYASPTGVLTPASGKEAIEKIARQIIESNLPQEQKLAALKDLHKQTTSQAGGAWSKFSSAEAEMLKHMNERQVLIDPLQRAVQQGEANLSNLGGAKAANAKPSLGWQGLAAKVPGALTGAGAAMSGAEAYERSQTGDKLGAGIAGTGAALEALGVLPHPIPKAIALAGGLGSAAALMGYDYLKPEVLDYLEKHGLYNSSVMPK